MWSLIQFNLPVLVAALLIGVVTGRWMFRRPAPRSDRGDSEAP